MGTRADLQGVRALVPLPGSDRVANQMVACRGAAHCTSVERLLVADHRGDLVGYASWRDDEGIGVIDSLAVRLDRQGWNVGEALLSAAVRELRHRGIRQVEATVRLGTEDLQGACESLGFRELGRSVWMTRGPEANAPGVEVPAGEESSLRARLRQGFHEAGTWLHYEKRLGRRR